MADLRKLKDEAAKAVAKGKYRRGAELYVELGRAEADEPMWPHRAGEAYKRAGARPEAIAQLILAAESYAKNGFLLKAISVAKMILELDPAHDQTQGTLASLYAKRDGATPRGAHASGSMPSLAMTTAAASFSATRIPSSASNMPPRPTQPPIPAQPRLISLPPSLPPALPPSLPPALPSLKLDFDPPSPPLLAVPDAPVKAPENDLFAIEVDEEFTSPAGGAPSLAGSKNALPTTDETDFGDLSSVRSVASLSPPRGAPRPSPTIDRLPLNQVIPGVRLTGSFAIDAFEIPLHEPSSSDDDAPDLEIEVGESESPALPNIPLFSSLDEGRLRRLIDRSRIVLRSAGETVLRQGEPGDSLYVIVRGEVAVSLSGVEQPVGTLGEGTFFGELALLTDHLRLATVTAISDVELLEIGRDVVWDLIEDAPDVLKTLLRFFRDRLVDRLIATSPMFASFPGNESRALAEQFEFLELPIRSKLTTEGVRADGLFVILCGQCEVGTDDGGAIATIGPGDLCGEMSLLTRRPAMATVTTLTRVWALGLSRARFQELILTHPHVLIYVNDVVEARRTAAEQRIQMV